MPVSAVVYAFHAMHPLIVLNSIKRRFRGLYARHFCKIASVEVGRYESSSTRTELSEVVTKLQTPSSNVWWHFAVIYNNASAFINSVALIYTWSVYPNWIHMIFWHLIFINILLPFNKLHVYFIHVSSFCEWSYNAWTQRPMYNAW